MNLKKLRAAMGVGIEVSRDRRKRVVTVQSSGLEYRADERRFGSEAELAEHLSSKLPALSIKPQ
jgi:hypothetical protein